MARDELSAKLLGAFLQELEEHVRGLTAALLELEKQPRDADAIRRLFRAAHTIKGAAGVAGVDIVERACHVLESVFAAVRDDGRELEGGEFSILFAAVDALSDVRQRLMAGEPLHEAPLARLLPTLDAMAQARRPAAQARRPAPPPRTPPPSAPAPDSTPARAPSEPPAGETEEWVRVPAARLDGLLAAAGELAIASARVVGHVGRHHEDARQLGAVSARIVDLVRNLRLRPFSDATDALPRAVRDVAARAGKRVTLRVEGQDVECDRMVVDALRDPLLHLVRNAVDHGIEPPEGRERAGKPAEGVIRVTAQLAAGRLVVSVEDDGAGLDEEAIRRALERRGRAAPHTRAEIADAVLSSGFSTVANPTAISGRGVGVDLARSAIERIGGTLELAWQRGRGTRFVLQCPPSPTTLRGLLVVIGRHTFAIPTVHVERVMRLAESDLHRSEGRTFARTEAGPLPVHSLAALLGPPLEARPLEGSGNMIVLSAGNRRAAFIVDDVVDETEIVVRPLDLGAGVLPYASGAALLPTGGVALVLAVGTLLGAGARAGMTAAPTFVPPRAAAPLRVLVADDSITTRLLEQSVLEAAGYDVLTAVDGEDAWRKLDEHGADVVVADVEMPRMDGFGLCRRIRASSRFAELPVIMVTALSSEEDRTRGLQAGADAYIVKSSFDQTTLLETIRQLVGEA